MSNMKHKEGRTWWLKRFAGSNESESAWTVAGAGSTKQRVSHFKRKALIVANLNFNFPSSVNLGLPVISRQLFELES